MNFIKSTYNGEIIEHFRHNYEIDIYVPDIKIGFEFNGLYGHSDIFRDRNYHLNKTTFFEERGIRIIHIWEDDWKYKREIVESQILNWIGQTPNKIWARDCQVSEIESCSLFLEKNHIQGKVNTTLKLGLFYQDELVSTMTFDQSEGRKKMPQNEWNLNRFCNKLNTKLCR